MQMEVELDPTLQQGDARGKLKGPYKNSHMHPPFLGDCTLRPPIATQYWPEKQQQPTEKGP